MVSGGFVFGGWWVLMWFAARGFGFSYVLGFSWVWCDIRLCCFVGLVVGLVFGVWVLGVFL